MGMFGGARQRALAAIKNPRDLGGDGLALADRRSGAMAPALMPAASNSPAVPNPSQWSVPIDGAPMPMAGVRLADTMPKKSGFFSKDGAWRDVVGSIGDSLAGRPIYMNAKAQQEQAARDEAWRQQQRQWQIEDRDWKAGQPEYFMSGRDRVRFNPLNGQSEVVYDGTEDFDQYAATLGLQPGTEEYFTAVQDYVLRGNGPSALGYDKQLDDYRTANDKTLDDYRTGNRVKVRGVPTWRDRNPTPSRARNAQRRPRATNAQGKAVEWNGKEWVDAK